MYHCFMEKNKLLITINTNGKKIRLQAPKRRQLKGLLSDAGIQYVLPCGGLGRCGKCRVRFLSGAPDVNSLDRTFLTEKEISDGFRLMCRCIITSDCEIVLDDMAFKEEEIEVKKTYKTREHAPLDEKDITGWGIAVDIGTTTLEAMLVGMNDKKTRQVFDIVSGINHQRKYGADVIARISAAVGGDGEKLCQSIREDIKTLIVELVNGRAVNKLDYICITGNTTMLHLLRGYDVAGLGEYPYKAVNLDVENISARELLGDLSEKDFPYLSETRAVLMPGISAFVGADIVSGIDAISMTAMKHKALFVDLGTNGEMAYWDGHKLFVTSTAAGPVFEAGGIVCGTAAIPGAIYGVHIEEKDGKYKVELETIKNKEPSGICGSGVLEAVSELVRNRIVDETGLLTKEYFETGFPLTDGENGIRIYQSDIRNVQLGKAAIAAAWSQLLGETDPEYIEISGGYSSSFDAKKIKYLKLFPQNSKIVLSASNAALVGCMYLLTDLLTSREAGDKAVKRLQKIAETAQVVELVNKADFAEKYVEAMNF